MPHVSWPGAQDAEGEIMKRTLLGILVTVVLALAMATSQRPAQAGIISGSVSLDTSALSGSFELAFILTDGSGTGDANNTVTLSNFLFGVGGSAGVVDTLLSTGGVSGDLTSSVSLVDSAFLNIFASSFTAGSLLSFDFDLTTNVDAGGTPDQFSLTLLQSDGTVINTDDPSGANSLLTVNLDSAHPAFNVFASELTPAPIVTEFSASPEPSSLPLLTMALVGALWLTPRRVAFKQVQPLFRTWRGSLGNEHHNDELQSDQGTRSRADDDVKTIPFGEL